MTSIMLVSYTFSRTTIDTSLSLIGISEIVRIRSYVDNTVTICQEAARGASLVDLSSVSDDIGLDATTSSLLYLSSFIPSRVYR